MKALPFVICALFIAGSSPSSAHRLDEYLQAATISLEPGRVHIQLRLTPGIAVFPTVFKLMDADRNGELSAPEQQAYANVVLHDVSLMSGQNHLPLTLTSVKYPKVEEMRQGRGEIMLEMDAVSNKGGRQTLIFENRHQSRIAVYLANCLVPFSPNVQVAAQRRNYVQSHYELDYTQSDVPTSQQSSVENSRSNSPAPIVVLGCASLVWLLVRPIARRLMRNPRSDNTKTADSSTQ